MRLNLVRLGAITDLRRSDVWPAPKLAAEVARRARVLAGLGVCSGRHVVIAHGGTPDFFADLLAVWWRGACAVCVNARLTASELTNIVEFVTPSAVLVDDGSAAGGHGLEVPMLCTGDEQPLDIQSSPGNSTLDDPALILFTSGTTGAPKGVVHTFRSLFARIALNQTFIGAARITTSLCLLPTHFGHGLIGNCLTPLFAGGDLLLFADSGPRAAAKLGTILTEHRVTFMSSVPTVWKIAFKTGRPPAESSLQQVHVGSAPLSADHWRAIADWTGTDNVVNMYGITETANWVAGASARERAPEDGLVGTMWGGSAAIKGADREVHDGDGGEGEILLQTPSLMTGYHKRPDLTDQVLRDGWYHTGDIGRIDGDGIIRLTGREKEEINHAGIKVHPAELDLLLERHPDVVEACAFGVPDDISGEVVGIAIQAMDGADIGAGALRRWCAERIKPEGIPQKWYFIAAIPKTDRGKTNRKVVMEYCLKGII